MGEGRHVSFTLAAGGARSRCVAFGRGSALPAAPGEPVDAAVRLEVNRYNGAVEPRLVLRARPAGAAGADPRRRRARAAPRRCSPSCRRGPRRRRGARRRARRRSDATTCAGAAGRPRPAARPRACATCAAAASRGLLGDLVAGGAPVLAVAAHARAPRAGARATASAASTSPPGRRSPPIPGWPRRTRTSSRSTRRRARRGRRCAGSLPGEGWVHLAWGEAEREFAARVLTWELDLRAPLAEAYRALRAAAAAAAAGEADLFGPGSASSRARRCSPRWRARARSRAAAPPPGGCCACSPSSSSS